MGEGSGKLRAWCRYEFGTAIGDAPGNCAACQKWHREAAEAKDAWAVSKAELTGEWPESFEPTRASTPCDVCPKMKLYPEWRPGMTRGLHPENELVVQMYNYAREDVRVGVFDGAPLIRTITITGALGVMDEFGRYYKNWLHRQHTLRRLMIIDEVATEVRSKQEKRERDNRRAIDETRRKRGQGGR